MILADGNEMAVGGSKEREGIFPGEVVQMHEIGFRKEGRKEAKKEGRKEGMKKGRKGIRQS